MTTTFDAGAVGDVATTDLVQLTLPAQPPRQSRLSVLLRALLAAPFGVAVVIFAIMTFFVTVAAWFAALATGRVPGPLRRLILAYVTYDARFVAFLFFLVRRPPLRRAVSSTTVPIAVHAPEVPLSRVAVAARVMLAAPALLVLSAFGSGMVLLWTAMLLCGLFTKSFPQPLTEVAALFLRFRVRTNAYLMLLTSQQPFAGLYGDGVAFASEPVGPANA